MAGMIGSAFFGDPYLGAANLDTLLDPARYTSLAARFVDRVAPP
jgi:hypothetical protein